MKFKQVRFAAGMLLLLLFPLLSSAVEPSAEVFQQGNAAYAKGNCKAALQNYALLVAGGKASAKVFYNMGNVYYRLGDIPSALLYYGKAHRLAPNDADVKVNIRVANQKTVDKIEESPVFFLNRWWDNLVMGMSLDALAALSIVFFLFGSGFLILYFYAHSPVLKRAGFYSALVFLCIGLMAFLLAGRQEAYFRDHRQAIIFTSPVTVKSAPADGAKSLFILHEGTLVELLEENGQWMKVKLADGKEGWMPASTYKEI